MSLTALSGGATGGPVQGDTERKCDKRSVENMRGPRLTVWLGFVTTDRDGGRLIRRFSDSRLLLEGSNQLVLAGLSVHDAQFVETQHVFRIEPTRT